MNRAVRLLAWCSIVAFVALTVFALGRYRGSAVVFLAFSACYVALLGLALPPPRLYGYTFLAAFFALGFWAKVVVHSLWPSGFIEPVGEFGNTPQEWDGALTTMSWAAIAIVLPRCAHLWWCRGGKRANAPARAPDWFVRWRRPVWYCTLALVGIVNAANIHFAFYQIGVNPKWILPLRLHIAVAWLINCGFSLWIAALLWWDFARERHTLGATLFAPLVESLLSSVSTFSRLAYLLHAGPYWLSLLERWPTVKTALPPQRMRSLSGWFFVLFAVSIVAVFWLRANFYPLHDRSMGNLVGRELPQLLIHRWVGTEGVLAVGAVANPGRELLFAAITDSPRRAGTSLYQRVAKMRHSAEDPSQFTFLTNAGPVAVLLFSGSQLVIFIGMALLGFIVIATEEAARRWTDDNAFLLAISGAALANVISQTTFFYLTTIFIAELWATLAFIGVLQRFPRPRA
jgi:hypothetical protein